MLNNNSNKIRVVGKTQMLQKPGGTKGRPRLLHNGINGQKGGMNAKGTPAKPAATPAKLTKVDYLGQMINVLRKKK